MISLNLLVLLGACSHPAPAPLVLLVSFDTTRADALGAWADVASWGRDLDPGLRPAPSTPFLDAITARGVRFRWALAQAPTTLSSHATVMSGLDPHRHEVVRNGFPVPAGVPLLAERFAAAGWDTLAVVGASPLEEAMGLGRGFREYDDAVHDRVRKRHEDPAPRVTERAIAAVKGRRDLPLLLFVHYFDAHSPWEAEAETVAGATFDGSGEALSRLIVQTRAGNARPEDRRQARARYLAEVSLADGALATLWGALEDGGLTRDALVVVFGDHGETLDEIPERPYGHGLDVDLVDVHVPLLIAGSGRFALSPAVVDRPVRLMDVAPTVLGLAGLRSDLGDGEDLSALVRGGAPTEAPPSFSEATKPTEASVAGQWPNLTLERAVAADGFFLTRAPYLAEGPRLARLAAGQPAAEDAVEEGHLVGLLDEWDAAAPGDRSVEMSPATREALEALGYLEDR